MQNGLGWQVQHAPNHVDTATFAGLRSGYANCCGLDQVSNCERQYKQALQYACGT